MTYIVCHSLCTKWYTTIKLCKRCTHRACNNTSYEKDICKVRYIYGKISKTWQGNVENTYVMQGRPIVQEIVRIIHELNCIHKDYSTVYQTSVL